ncbi:Hypothetical protein ETEE_0376 [Edwardsiella anguillarum ET080813]|uniref:Uncharacterized protein n=1 Tax=Edwardsiella anguillarum ET080813 TaxID=667120 RepID=A0A076LMC8_9GAMM|nr:Hypothetical protein ETEE_0376 [Edwardsiella anguillarum ET080813]
MNFPYQTLKNVLQHFPDVHRSAGEKCASGIRPPSGVIGSPPRSA